MPSITDPERENPLDDFRFVKIYAKKAQTALGAHIRRNPTSDFAEPYINHCARVAERVLLAVPPKWKRRSHLGQAIAWMHDIGEMFPPLENWQWNIEHRPVWKGMEALTRKTGETYTQYITRIWEGPSLYRIIKIADIEDNLSDLGACPLRQRYEVALELLKRRRPRADTKRETAGDTVKGEENTGDSA